MIARFRSAYGAGPVHLLGHLVAFVAFVWAFSQILGGGFWINYVAWFVGAAVLHDLLLLPLYSLVDRLARREGRSLGLLASGAINYVRAPAIVSAVLMLVYFPVILGYAGPNYRDDTGHALHGYLRNWLLITAALFLLSGLVYTTRAFRARLLADTARLSAERESGHS